MVPVILAGMRFRSTSDGRGPALNSGRSKGIALA